MRRFRAAAILTLVLFGAGWLASDWTVERTRRWLEKLMVRELGGSARIGSLRVSFVPPQVDVTDFEMAPHGTALRIARARVRLRVLTSLRQLRPVGDVTASGVFVDPEAFAAPGGEREDGHEGPPPLFPFRARRVDVRNATVLVPYPGEALRIVAARVRGHYEVGRVHGRMSFGADAESVHLQRAGGDVALDTVRFEAGHMRKGLAARELELRGEGIEVAMVLDTPVLTTMHHNLRGTLDLRHLRPLTGEIRPPLRGRATVEGEVIGSLTNPGFEVSAHSDALELGTLAFSNVTVRAERRGTLLRIVAAEAAAYGGVLRGDGQLTLKAPLAYEAKLVAENLSAAELAGKRPEEALLPGHLNAVTEASGELEPPSIRGKMEGKVAGAAAVLEWNGTASYAGGRGQIEIAIAQGVTNRARSELVIEGEGSIGGKVQVEIGDTAALQALFGTRPAPAKGSFFLTAEVSGTTRDPGLKGELRAEHVDVFGAAVDSGSAALAIDRNALRIERLAVALGGGSGEASGVVALSDEARNEWRAAVNGVSSETVVSVVQSVLGCKLPLWRGKLFANASGSGAWAAPVLDASAALDDFRIDVEPFERAEGTVQVRWPKWQAELHLRHFAGEWLDASAGGTGSDRLSLRVSSSRWQLGRLRGASLAGLDGTAWLSADLDGPARALDGSAEVAVSGLTWKERAAGDVRLAAMVRSGRWQVAGRALSDSVELEADLRPEPGIPAVLDARWSEAPLGAIVSPGQVDIFSSGRAHLEGRLLDPSSIDGELRIETLSLVHPPYTFAASRPVVVHARAGEFTMDSLVLEGHDTRLQASARWSTGGSLHAEIAGGGNLSIAELLSGRVRSARGAFRIDARVARLPGRPLQLFGSAGVQEAALDFGLPIAFSEVNGRIGFADDRVHVDEISGRAGGGTFELHGSVDPLGGPGIDWSVREISTGVPEIEHEVSGRGRLEGSWRDLRVKGDIELLRALYSEPLELIDFIPLFRRKVERPPPKEPPARNVHLDLHVVAPDEIFIDNNVAKVEMRADLRVGGTVREPTLNGSVEVLAGQVTFRDRIFEVTDGTIEFRPELGREAALNMSAETLVETPDTAYTVHVQVIGTTEEYRVLLGSDDPTLSQTDLVSLITFGKTEAQLRQSGAGFSTADLLTAGAGVAKGGVETRVRRFLPVDRFEVEPAFSRTTGAFEPRVSIGKNFTEDLSASVSSSFGVSAQRSVQLEYRLTPRISLLGSWESETEKEAGAFAGGVKGRFEFRRLPKFSLLGRGGCR